jgi:hypothetical protein
VAKIIAPNRFDKAILSCAEMCRKKKRTGNEFMTPQQRFSPTWRFIAMASKARQEISLHTLMSPKTSY